MSWFGGVRTSIPVTSSETFLMAGEARELIEAETGYGDHDKHPLAERPSDDWAGAATLLLARVQLQEAIAILSTLLGEDVSHWTPERLGEELTWRVEAATDDGEDDLSFEIGMLGEALTLFRALHVSPTVSHAYAPDGRSASRIPASGSRRSSISASRATATVSWRTTQPLFSLLPGAAR